MVFARTPAAEQKLIQMFAKHDVQRAYVAVVYGHVGEQTIDTHLVRDRGDGLRGSTATPTEDSRRAITHIRPLELLRDYTVIECRLETGRTGSECSRIGGMDLPQLSRVEPRQRRILSRAPRQFADGILLRARRCR